MEFQFSLTLQFNRGVGDSWKKFQAQTWLIHSTKVFAFLNLRAYFLLFVYTDKF